MSKVLKNSDSLRTIGDRLRYLLEVRKMKQTEAAQAAGITQAAISNLVTDNSRKPSAPTLLKLAAVLQASSEWIMTGKGEPLEINVIGRTAEKELLDAFRNMDEQSKAALLGAAQAMRK